MMTLSANVIAALQGKTLATAESCTGGLIGGALTAVSGSSKVYKGGIVSYTNEVKHSVLGVKAETLEQYGAVSAPVAQQMAAGVRELVQADVAVSVTGLAGPGGDDFGNPVGTVYIGYSDHHVTESRKFLLTGNREEIRRQAVEQALQIILEHQ